MEASLLEQCLDLAGGSTVGMASGHETAAPQISPSLASVGFASSDGNMGRSKFKDQLIKKLTRTLTLLKPGRNKHKPLNGFVAASSGTQTGQGIQGSSASGRIRHVGPESTRYVDFLAYQGYIVGILGGNHFKTPEGEFVEMKSGTQYKIHVKNTHAYGKKISLIHKSVYKPWCMITY